MWIMFFVSTAVSEQDSDEHFPVWDRGNGKTQSQIVKLCKHTLKEAKLSLLYAVATLWLTAHWNLWLS